MYWEKRNWEKYRRSLLENINCEKQNKHNFEQQLRLPIVRINYMKAPLNKIDIKSSDSNVYFTVLDEASTATNAKTKKPVRTDLQKAYQSLKLPRNANS